MRYAVASHFNEARQFLQGHIVITPVRVGGGVRFTADLTTRLFRGILF